ncbi:MAG: hypothetical protein ACXACC_10070 [Promethearchaeota archaeon]|jgi:hypothetical protein
MKLKKNDKIILIVGIVILIASGAGIALYTAEDSEDNEVTEDSNIYSYSWMRETKEINIGTNLQALKNVPYENMRSIISPTNTVLTNVEIELSWQDDNTYGLLNKNKGLDTLNAEISYKNQVETITSEGGGNETVPFSINSKPIDDTVQAKSELDAEDLIEDLISGYNEATFNFIVTVTPGERFWRLLQWRRDKGNEFDLTAHLTYYSYELEQNTNNNDNDDNKNMGYSDGDFGHKIGEFYINLGYGRGMI